jgi:glycosyltransferase involved in cell wall biosynthesis
MKRVIILQPYNTPYRNSLFDEVASFPDIDLYVVYFGQKEESRKWDYTYNPKFKEIQLTVTTEKISYEHNEYYYNIFEVLKVLKKINPHVVIGDNNKVGTLYALCKYVLGYKLIHWTESTRVTSNDHIIKPKSKILFYYHVDGYIVPGKLAGEYLDFAGVNVSKQNLFYAANSIEDTNFKSDASLVYNKFTNPSKIKFLFSGHLTQRKGADLLLNAIKIINQRDYFKKYEFNFVGDPVITDPTLENVNYHGFKNGNEYIEFFKASHVLILPSRYDCNPLVVVEALKSGNIILISDGVGNYPEYATTNGYSFQRNSVNAIVEAIDKILRSDINTLRNMALQSLKIGEEVTPKKSAEGFYKAINYVLN